MRAFARPLILLALAGACTAPWAAVGGGEAPAVRQAAEATDVRALVNLAYRYDEGVGVAPDPQRAARLYRLAALQGDVTAQNNLALMYREGRGVAQDDAEAAQWLKRAAASGDLEAVVNLGVLYEQGRGVAQDVVEATRLYRQAAEAGDERGRSYLQALARRCARAATCAAAP